VFEDIDSNEQLAARTGQGIVRMLAYYEKRLKEKKRFLSPQSSVFYFFEPSSGRRV
jgi:hypothetical protein